MSGSRKVVLINYADDLFIKSQKKNSKTGKKNGLFDEIISYHPKDIDNDFRKKNRDILTQKRGGGFWLWKPYFIKKTLETLKNGDFLFYCDSGSYFINSISEIILLSIDKKQDVIPFELIHFEKEWTKRDAFVLMDCDTEKYFETKQRLASFVLIRKSETSMNFVNQWLDYAQDERILTDRENQCGFENYLEFKQHRHDQSIFSLLTKKFEFKAYRDPSEYGNSLEESYPDSKYKQFIVHTRERNYSLYKLINMYIDSKYRFLKSKF
jgi:hypothetical protein